MLAAKVPRGDRSNRLENSSAHFLTSFPVGMCLASLTLAKFPFPIVLSSLYFPMWGSSPVRREDIRAEDEPSPPWKTMRRKERHFSNAKYFKVHSFADNTRAGDVNCRSISRGISFAPTSVCLVGVTFESKAFFDGKSAQGDVVAQFFRGKTLHWLALPMPARSPTLERRGNLTV